MAERLAEKAATKASMRERVVASHVARLEPSLRTFAARLSTHEITLLVAGFRRLLDELDAKPRRRRQTPATSAAPPGNSACW